jgi:hypothetical protein
LKGVFNVPKICYTPKKFSKDHQAIIDKANAIIENYEAQGLSLTLRQLYYRFIAAAAFPNTEQSYKRLGSIISDARRAGEIDWNAIEDRTRNLRDHAHWSNPGEIVDSCARQYDVDHWENQDNYVECWVEKDALVGVLEMACDKWQVPYFSCRGYTSDSEAWSAGMRLARKADEGKSVHISHLGDHDPSGIDMTRDISDRIRMFGGLKRGIVNRVALNMDQIEQYQPPPNPAKTTDARYANYSAMHGEESWELDALEPAVLIELIEKHIQEFVDDNEWQASQNRKEEGRKALRKVAKGMK